MDWTQVRAWRKEARQKILAARAAIAAPVRKSLSEALMRHLRPVLKDRPQPISFYWPIKAEPDFRPLMQELDAAGVAICLPVAIKLGEPLRFRPWRKGCAMERGFWNIPVPATEVEVEPRTLIAPVVGYDGENYRLGYGGGFFDRTLAKFAANAAAIGVGYTMFRLDTIEPQPHDIRMSAIATEAGASLQPKVRLASEVCYLDEAEASYAGFWTAAETVAALESLRAALPPERVGLLDYALWRLGRQDGLTVEPSGDTPATTLDRVLPRIRDDALHATLATLRASLPA
jgi:5,10-methenyltetrahydrofolate synthetase